MKLFDTDWSKEVDRALARAATLKGDDYVYDDEALKLTIISIKKDQRQLDKMLVN